MSKKSSHDQEITRYLLGSLPGREAERLDKLSFTDDEFVDALSAVEAELVDAYVRGELTGAELEQFNTHYLASPLRRERVKFAEALRDFAEARAAAEVRGGGSRPAEAGGEMRGWLSGLNLLAGPRPALRWGGALAALALLAAGGWLTLDSVRLRREASQTQAARERGPGTKPEGESTVTATPEQERPGPGRTAEEAQRPPEQQRETPRASPPNRASVASFVLTPQVRGAGSVAEVRVPAGTTHVMVRLELEPNEYHAYRVALLDPSDDRNLWSSARLRPTAGGAAVVARFSAGLLKPRLYTLRVTGVSAGGAPEIVGAYTFRVVK